jgi:hypothetical protein
VIGFWCLELDSLCNATLALQMREDQILCHSQPDMTILLSLGNLESTLTLSGYQQHL